MLKISTADVRVRWLWGSISAPIFDWAQREYKARSEDRFEVGRRPSMVRRDQSRLEF